MGKAKHYIIVATLVVISTLFLRWVLLYLYRLPDPASAQAVPIDQMFNAHFWLISFLFSLIMVFMLYSIVVFKRRQGDDEPGPYVHGNTTIEIIWTVIPVLVVIGFGYWGVTVLNALTAEQPDEMTIKVYGQQWSWQFEYPEQEGITSSDLILPVDQKILLEMESLDVPPLLLDSRISGETRFSTPNPHLPAHHAHCRRRLHITLCGNLWL
ncbi:MAG: cytochrome c oxidase subunit II [Chloroflexi bacterium]|nr:cytochrome c oxidase subunit II [Chloroflexota bacterium]